MSNEGWNPEPLPNSLDLGGKLLDMYRRFGFGGAQISEDQSVAWQDAFKGRQWTTAKLILDAYKADDGQTMKATLHGVSTELNHSRHTMRCSFFNRLAPFGRS